MKAPNKRFQKEQIASETGRPSNLEAFLFLRTPALRAVQGRH
jgi:hypothetical protein